MTIFTCWTGGVFVHPDPYGWHGGVAYKPVFPTSINACYEFDTAWAQAAQGNNWRYFEWGQRLAAQHAKGHWVYRIV